MSAIHDLIGQIQDAALRERIAAEVNRIVGEKKFGLVFEELIPEITPLSAIPPHGILINLEHTLNKGQSSMDSAQEIIEALRRFNSERDWEQFHDAKTLALELSIEAAELNEAFLWKKAEHASREKVAEELADVFLYAFMLSDKYSLDIRDICLSKIRRNAEKDPSAKARGSLKKHSEL